jgi:hypothetical protein
LLLARGVPAWMAAWQPLRPADPRPATAARLLPEAVVAVLASMAAACLAGR